MVQGEKYQVIRKLDAGGMAEVYEGVAEGIQGFKKKVAIKRVLPHLSEKRKFIALFLDEARVSLHLSHANIVQVFDIGEAGGTYFIVMEFVDGTNLKRLFNLLVERGETLPVEQSVFIAMEACRGLSYAHRLTDADGSNLGIVHRDVSPPNILLSKQGEVKIVDFGLAKANSQLEQTAPGVVKGKYAYLSPESAKGKSVDHRMDVFCVGIVLWELLTGRRLFLGKNDVETIRNVRAAKIPPIPSLNPRVTRELDAIVLKALRVNPEDRYQSCDEMAEAMADFLFSSRLKVTGYDLRKTIEMVMEDTKRKEGERPSLIDELIQDELSVFASLDGKGDKESKGKSDSGDKPLVISGFDRLSGDQGAGTGNLQSGDSQPDSLENMLEGGLGEDYYQDGSGSGSNPDNEARQNFILGLVLALAVATVGFVAAWLLGLLS